MSAWSPRSVRWIAEVVGALWFVPAMMAAAGVALGFAMPLVDADPGLSGGIGLGWVGAVLDATPSGAQQLLATSAGALATILGVAFSLTLVTLQLAAAQYTPRLVGRLLEDRVTKIVLGSYIGTVAYLLLVLRSVHGASDGRETFVPRLGILLALILILGCLGLLAYFVHHLGESIQAENVGARVVEKTVRAIRRLGDDDDGSAEAERPEPPADAARVPSAGYGYVQLVDLERLASALPSGVSCARVEAAAGDHVLPGTPLVTLWPCRHVAPRDERALRGAFALGSHRTGDQDVLYGVRQLVDVALKALSPGMNDETTAVTVVNQLGAVLAAACAGPADGGGWRRHRLDGATVYAPALTVRRLVEDSFAGLIRFSGDHPRVLARIVEVLGEVAARQPEGDPRAAILDVAAWIEHVASRADFAPHERRLLDLRLAQFRAARARAPADRPHAMH